MSKFDERINELIDVLNEAALLNTILNTIIVFLISYIFFSLFNLFPISISTIISLLYLLYIWVKKSDFYDIKLVEKKFPFLKERLSTAKETINKDNFVINALRLDVSRRINHIDAISFFKAGRTVVKIIVILSLLFGILFVAANNIEIVDLNEKIGNINFSGIFSFLFSSDEKDDKEKDELNLNDSIDAIQIDEIQDNFKKEDFINLEDLEAIGSEEFIDSITEEEKEIVKKYFETIRER